MDISLFIACYNDTLFPQTGVAVTRVLERLGHAVHFDRDQTCCGQMHYNTGYHREAVPLVAALCLAVQGCRSGLRAFGFLRGNDARALRADCRP